MNASEIIKTTDYSVFRKMKGNRPVEEKRVKGLMSSIQKIGWISNPIIVNERMEVIDGQGRLEALKRLGLPVEYHIVKNAGLEDCRTMNSHMSAWGNMDFVDSFAVSKNENYVRVSQLMKYYGVNLETIMTACGKGASGKGYAALREGQLTFTELDYIVTSRRMNLYMKYAPIFDRFGGHKRTKMKVIFYLIKYGEDHPDFDHDKMLDCLSKCDPQTVFTANFERLLESVQTVYNYNRKKKEGRLYIYEEYRLEKKVK